MLTSFHELVCDELPSSSGLGGETILQRVLILGYGVMAYLIFLVVFAYTIGFLANAGVPKGIDEGTVGPV